MKTVVKVQEAQAHLPELLRRVEAGEDIKIARAGRVIARLQAVDTVERSFEDPLLPGIPQVDESALRAPGGEEELRHWEEGHSADPLVP